MTSGIKIYRVLIAILLIDSSLPKKGYLVFKLFGVKLDPKFWHLINVTNTRYRQMDTYSNLGFEGTVELLKEIPCTAIVKYAMYAKVRGEFNTQPTFAGEMLILDSVDLDKTQHMPPLIRTFAGAYRRCCTPMFYCPMPAGEVVSVNYVNGSRPLLVDLPTTNDWNMTAAMYIPGTGEVSSLWWQIGFDDAPILKAKRPSTTQRRRQKYHQRRNNATNSD